MSPEHPLVEVNEKAENCLNEANSFCLINKRLVDKRVPQARHFLFPSFCNSKKGKANGARAANRTIAIIIKNNFPTATPRHRHLPFPIFQHPHPHLNQYLTTSRFAKLKHTPINFCLLLRKYICSLPPHNQPSFIDTPSAMSYF